MEGLFNFFAYIFICFFHTKEHFGLIHSIISLHRKTDIVQSGCITLWHFLQFTVFSQNVVFLFCHIMSLITTYAQCTCTSISGSLSGFLFSVSSAVYGQFVLVRLFFSLKPGLCVSLCSRKNPGMFTFGFILVLRHGFLVILLPLLACAPMNEHIGYRAHCARM